MAVVAVIVAVLTGNLLVAYIGALAGSFGVLVLAFRLGETYLWVPEIHRH